jgi:hypothetical protein
MKALIVTLSCLMWGVTACQSLQSGSGFKYEAGEGLDRKKGLYKPSAKAGSDTLRLIQERESKQICDESERIQELCTKGSLFNEPPLMTSTSILFCLSLKEGELTYECMTTLVGYAISQDRLNSCDNSKLEFYEMLECLENLTKE